MSDCTRSKATDTAVSMLHSFSSREELGRRATGVRRYSLSCCKREMYQYLLQSAMYALLNSTAPLRWWRGQMLEYRVVSYEFDWSKTSLRKRDLARVQIGHFCLQAVPKRTGS
eukprot:scaffold4941_cov139-Skeletonema_marinoi.AAC.1